MNLTRLIVRKYRVLFVVLMALMILPAYATDYAVDRYFPQYKLPFWWFQLTGIERVYETETANAEWYSNRRHIDGMLIPIYSRPYISRLNSLSTNVSLALRANTIRRGGLNESSMMFTFNKSIPYFGHALPVIFKYPEVPDITLSLTGKVAKGFDDYKRFMSDPGGADTLGAKIIREGFSHDKFRREFFINNPQLVQHDWHALPDLPESFGKSRRRTEDAERMARELLKEQKANIETTTQLSKVDAAKQLWTFSGTENVQLSQSYLKNWVRGGQQSVALLSDLRFSAVYKKDNVQWDNNFTHKIGIIDSEDSKSRINDDLIEVTSKYGVNASKKWYYSLLFSFKTQFFDGYASSDKDKVKPISSVMSPGYFSLAAGMDYKTKNFTLLLSPITSRLTVVMDTAKVDQTRYSIAADKKSLFLTGASFQNNLTWKVSKDIEFKSAMNVFYDYFEKENKVQADWDLTLDMKINVFMTTRITTNLKYYESESSKLQVRENMSIAFRYRF